VVNYGLTSAAIINAESYEAEASKLWPNLIAQKRPSLAMSVTNFVPSTTRRFTAVRRILALDLATLATLRFIGLCDEPVSVFCS
jgi:hypothetical protein